MRNRSTERYCTSNIMSLNFETANIPFKNMMSAIYVKSSLHPRPFQPHHHSSVGAAVGAGGVEGTAEDVLGRDAPLFQHLQDGGGAHLGGAGGHLSNVDQTFLACVVL